MTDPTDALEWYGPLYNCLGQTSTTVHISRDCGAIRGDPRKITHAAQLPLSADVCRVCDPNAEL